MLLLVSRVCFVHVVIAVLAIPGVETHCGGVSAEGGRGERQAGGGRGVRNGRTCGFPEGGGCGGEGHCGCRHGVRGKT